jgi:hypothetical protein
MINKNIYFYLLNSFIKTKMTYLYDLLEENINNLRFDYLSENKSAIPFLEKHVDKVNWSLLSENPKPLFIKWRQNV